MIKIMISISLIFIFLSHPLSISILLFIQTILVSLISGVMNNNFWFSYILFLILIGGLMILFIYMTSIASNEKFHFSPELLSIFILSLVILMFYKTTFNIQNMNNLENLPALLAINKPMNTKMVVSFNLIIVYLFIALIAVTNMTKSTAGPLRQLS
uniref:NADH-ubiquinone oxidoreductase chain 6 n=1 Tax=Curculionoidea sp. 24 KM-2017 TaxID=2219408 RepID=A0A346RKK1_9CUCU|nr:NADH dehydrogenase subunit 6 [Curculionoidea sp. 24 KM-2017]